MRKVQGKRLDEGKALELSYEQLKAIQEFVRAVIQRKMNIYDALSAELDEAQKAFERWSNNMEKCMVKGND